MEPQTLTADEVLEVYLALVRDFAASDDPIAPAGVKSRSMLESAVFRQHTSLGQRLKYPDPLRNAASLTFGICKDHPFHNGNKRCALVAMLVHLDRNKYTLYGVSQKDLYAVMLRVAAGTMSLSGAPRTATDRPRVSADSEIEALAGWLAQHVGRLARGERQITYRQLRTILQHHGYALGEGGQNSVDILKREIETVLFRRKERWRRIGSIGYHNEGTFVALKELKKVRTICKLREEDGVDSNSFYDLEETVDAFVNTYRGVLRRLGRT